MFRNDDSCILGDVASSVLSSFLDDETAKPLRYTFSSFDKESFTESINASRVVSTVALSMPVFLAISFTISALVISLIIIVIRYLKFLDCKYICLLYTSPSPRDTR